MQKTLGSYPTLFKISLKNRCFSDPSFFATPYISAATRLITCFEMKISKFCNFGNRERRAGLNFESKIFWPFYVSTCPLRVQMPLLIDFLLKFKRRKLTIFFYVSFTCPGSLSIFLIDFLLKFKCREFLHFFYVSFTCPLRVQVV